MDSKLPKHRDWTHLEPQIQKLWIASLARQNETESGAETYTIMMPPPNVTGTLHAGHALNMTTQDILIRWNRMIGKDSLWIPGTDHAGIATQNVMERRLRAKGQSRFELGREAFEAKIHSFTGEHQRIIREQLQALGASPDWSREQFTMNPRFQRATKEAFCRLYETGKIYRGQYLVNWCCRCQTALSKEESPKIEKRAMFYTIRYDLADEDGSISIATTRPETLLGDTAIAVNPKDPIYQSFIGKEAILPILGRRIPIIADSHAQFGENQIGTGALKVTPAHDPHDFEIAKRHKLPMISLLTDDGHMNENSGEWRGLPSHEARQDILKRLTEEGRIEKIEALSHGVPECYRCHTDIEPRLSTQWFVSMGDMANRALEKHRAGEINWQPSFYGKIFEHWLENIQDWCISRSLWWGHRIPAYFCLPCNQDQWTLSSENEYRFNEHSTPIVARETPKTCPSCGSAEIIQDCDVLDTWFSSWLWPFAAFGWPNENPDLARYYPSQTLITGKDILFFWVSRMIMAGLEFTDQLPFKTALIHGMVTDEHGEILTKSRGNGMDPREIVRSDSADALRFALMFSGSEGGETRLSEDHIRQGRSFTTKIWNAARLILGQNHQGEPGPESLNSLEDQWMAERIRERSRENHELLAKNKIQDALQALYLSFRNEFCDWYLESLKRRWQDPEITDTTAIARMFFGIYLRLLHPFLPFITEMLWDSFRDGGDLLMNAQYPSLPDTWHYQEETEAFEQIQTISRSIRDFRRRRGISHSLELSLFFEPRHEFEQSLKKGGHLLQGLAGLKSIQTGARSTGGSFCQITVGASKAWIESSAFLDHDREKTRILGKLSKLAAGIATLQTKLANKGFLENAPEAVIERSRASLEDWKREEAALKEELDGLD